MTVPELYKIFLEHPTITIDSRNCPPESIFFALRGSKSDGNAYASSALSAGSSFAVIDDASYLTDPRMLLVNNVLEALQSLAQLHRQTLKTPVLAITGTNGKTTTKELIAAVLSRKFNVLYTQGNLNNHIGVPLTLLRLTPAHEIAAIEMGANHPGEIRTLAEIAQPDYGLITNVGCAHLEGFGSLEGVIKTKCELLDYLIDTGGTFFMNTTLESDITASRHCDPSVFRHCEGEARSNPPKIIRYSETNKTQEPPTLITGEVTARHPFLAFKWQQSAGVEKAVQTHLVGDYNLLNALAAITVGVYFGVKPDKINSAIAEYQPSNNRSQLVKTADNELIIDAYNANPSSMRAALANFAASESSPKAVILGDMLELGDQSLHLHKEITELITASRFDKVLLCGADFTAVAGSTYPCFISVEQLINYLKINPLKGYTILLKASHGININQAADFL